MKHPVLAPAGAAVVLAAIAGGIWYLAVRGPGEEAFVSPLPLSGALDLAALSKSAPPREGYIEYRNERYGFSYYHSPQAVITEYDEGGGAMTLTHENFEKVRGFQVFIVPYAEAEISEERFRMDVPSGIRENVENTTIDGVRAVTFNSVDENLGETREIWLIKDGYLYEITTFKGVRDWFTPLIQTWKFI